MANASYQPKIYKEQGGARLVAASGGSIDVESGAEIDIESGGVLQINGSDFINSAGGVRPPGLFGLAVETSTSTEALASYGVSIVSPTTPAGPKVWTMDPPSYAGVLKTVICNYSTSTGATIVYSTDAPFGVAGAYSLLFSTGSANPQIVNLIAATTALWCLIGKTTDVAITST